MKKVLFFLATLWSTHVISQPGGSDPSVTCTAHWKKGEERIFTIFQTNYSTAEESTPLFHFEYEATVTVLDSGAQGYTLQWAFHLPDLLKEARPKLADSLPVYEGLKMIYHTDPAGAFKDLVNWQEVLNAYVKMMEIPLHKPLDSTMQASLEQTKALFNTREAVEGALIKEIQLFHTPYGHPFTTRAKAFSSTLPNPWSKEPLPGIQTWQITGMNEGPSYILGGEQDIDSSGIQGVMKNIMKNTPAGTDSVAREIGQALAQLKIHDRSSYHIDRSTGWVNKVEYTRTVQIGRLLKKNTYEISFKQL